MGYNGKLKMRNILEHFARLGKLCVSVRRQVNQYRKPIMAKQEPTQVLSLHYLRTCPAIMVMHPSQLARVCTLIFVSQGRCCHLLLVHPSPCLPACQPHQHTGGRHIDSRQILIFLRAARGCGIWLPDKRRLPVVRYP